VRRGSANNDITEYRAAGCINMEGLFPNQLPISIKKKWHEAKEKPVESQLEGTPTN